MVSDDGSISDDLVDGYFRYQRYLAAETARRLRERQPIPIGPPDLYSPRWTWLLEMLTGTRADGPERAWPVILELISRAPDRTALVFIGSSSLEDLVDVAGEAFADRIEAAASSDPRFRIALAAVWPGVTVPPRLTSLVTLARESDRPEPRQ